MVSQIKKINKQKDYLEKKNKSSLFSSTRLFFCLLFLIGCFGLGYIFQVNKIAVMGYEIKDHEEEIKSLEDQSDKLKIEVASLQSICLLEEKKAELKMVIPTQVDYLELNSLDKLVMAQQ